MISKVVIAAAGQGTRMLQLSQDRSKHLICVNNRPFLAYLMDNLLLAGYGEIILVVGFKKELMNEFVDNFLHCSEAVKKSGLGNKIKIEIVDQYEILGPKEKEYGTACPVKCVKEQVGKEGFLTIEESKSFETYVEYKQGLEFDRGIYSQHFVTNGETSEAIIEDPYILITDIKIICNL